MFALFDFQENGFVPKVDQPVVDGQMHITLVTKINSEWGSVLVVQKKGDNVSTYENVDVNAYVSCSYI